MNHTQKNHRRKCYYVWTHRNAFLRHLNSNKFHCGDELDGYINISDVYDYLLTIKDSLLLGNK